MCRSINYLVVQMANLFDLFFLSVFFFYSNNVQNIEAGRINLLWPTGYSCRIYETLTFWYSKHCIKRRSDYWKKTMKLDTVSRWKWKSAVFRFSRRNNYSHNIKCLREVEFYMRIGYSCKWNSMRIWHFKLRIIRRYAAYLGHW